jgi:hypothetical protein
VNRRRTFSRAALVAAALVFAGCSGSTETPELVLSEQNAEAVAAQGVAAAEMVQGMSEMVEGFATVFEEPEAPAQMMPCVTGNAYSSLNDVAPQGQLSTGDSASLTFNACVIDLGELSMTLDGTLSFTAVEVTDAEPARTLTIQVSFQSLSIGIAGASIVLDGGFTHELSTADGVAFTSIVSGDYFRAFAQGAEGPPFSGTISDFRLERQYDVESGAYLWDLDASVTGSGFGGRVMYDTTSPFTGVEGDYPDAGVFVVTGANDATATLVTLEDDAVEIQLDLDADGTPEVTINTTWDVLDS